MAGQRSRGRGCFISFIFMLSFLDEIITIIINFFVIRFTFSHEFDNVFLTRPAFNDLNLLVLLISSIKAGFRGRCGGISQGVQGVNYHVNEHFDILATEVASGVEVRQHLKGRHDYFLTTVLSYD